MNLKFAKLDIKLFDEVLEQVSTVVHELHGNFLKKHLCYVLTWILKVFKKKNEDFLFSP